MKRIIFLTLFLAASLLSAGNAQAQEKYRMTLEDCLNHALGYNYNRQSVKLSEEAKEESYRQSKMERLPSLNASASENLSHTKGNSAQWGGSVSANANMTLYQGMSTTNTIKQSALAAEQAEYRTSQYDNELTIKILQSFLTVLGNEELLKFQRTVLETSEAQKNNGLVLWQAGSILESDYLMLESQYETDKDNILETEISRNNSLLALKNLLSMDLYADLEIIYPDTSAIESLTLLPTENVVLDRSMNTLPDLKISEYGVDIAAMGLKISKSGFYPTLSLGGSIGTRHTEFSGFGSQLSDNRNEQIGLSLSIPIFNKNRNRSQVTQSKIALQQAELDNQQTTLDIQQTIIQEYRNVIAARSKYQASTVKENAYRKSFEAYSAKFNAGAITTVELLQQQNNYINALNDYIQNKYGFILKRKVLDVYMGEPVTM